MYLPMNEGTKNSPPLLWSTVFPFGDERLDETIHKIGSYTLGVKVLNMKMDFNT